MARKNRTALARAASEHSHASSGGHTRGPQYSVFDGDMDEADASDEVALDYSALDALAKPPGRRRVRIAPEQRATLEQALRIQYCLGIADDGSEEA